MKPATAARPSPDAWRLQPAASADESALYTYYAEVERVVDGDTIIAIVDLGFGITTRQYLRLRGIDCPEINTPEGKKAKKLVESLLSEVTCITLCSSRSDKYDRYLADVFVPVAGRKTQAAGGGNGNVKEQRVSAKGDACPQAPSGQCNTAQEIFLNQRLLDENLAVRM